MHGSFQATIASKFIKQIIGSGWVINSDNFNGITMGNDVSFNPNNELSRDNRSTSCFTRYHINAPIISIFTHPVACISFLSQKNHISLYVKQAMYVIHIHFVSKHHPMIHYLSNYDWLRNNKACRCLTRFA